MGSFRHEQQRFNHRGRDFFFMTYEASEANPKKNLLELPTTWYLLSSNNRWPAIAHVIGQPKDELVAALTAWLDENVFATPAAAPATQR